VRNEILDLLMQLKEKHNLTYIFISHDLRLINFVTDSILVLKEGQVIEQGNTQEIFQNPSQHYTKSLIGPK